MSAKDVWNRRANVIDWGAFTLLMALPQGPNGSFWFWVELQLLPRAGFYAYEDRP